MLITFNHIKSYHFILPNIKTHYVTLYHITLWYSNTCSFNLLLHGMIVYHILSSYWSSVLPCWTKIMDPLFSSHRVLRLQGGCHALGVKSAPSSASHMSNMASRSTSAAWSIGFTGLKGKIYRKNLPEIMLFPMKSRRFLQFVFPPIQLINGFWGGWILEFGGDFLLIWTFEDGVFIV